MNIKKRINLGLCTLACLLLSWQTQAQTNKIGTSGDVGIGTDNPNLKLHVVDDVSNVARFESTNNTDNAQSTMLLNVGLTSRAMIKWHKEGGSSYKGALSFGTRGVDGLKERLFINGDGKVGIGTETPFSTAHVKHSESGLGISDVSGLIVENSGSSNDYCVFQAVTKGGGKSFSITNAGNVGIGTTTPDAKLAVKGTIHTQEVKVDMNGWSDFVFFDNYNLRSLEETEQYIQENQHLPDIPSEAEVTANGINLGEMDAKLLQKIEELTLYLIEQNKEIESLKTEIKALKNQSK
ncbi:tail fiber protein [Reichenbachiella ulvae]|uniref:Tail fiber protein n=1 Tax=Reichenbachiella ulvae TaxID=2980104 RepID=A0ABT3CV36_9BACT|nr:tail fiber protein [Reichenbachiella ulvae]MCV9387479.1 tail fiber protein [Reichenbachiella ulvae]